MSISKVAAFAPGVSRVLHFNGRHAGISASEIEQVVEALEENGIYLTIGGRTGKEILEEAATGTLQR